MNDFSNIELQLIKSSLATRTDGEIAELLERSLDDIRAVLSELTGGQLGERTREVNLYKEEKQNARKARNKTISQPKSLVPIKVKDEFAEKRRQQNKQRLEAEAAWHRQRSDQQQREFKRTYKIKEVDYTTMKSVRVSRNTFVYVDKSVSDEEAIRKYNYNLEHNKERPHLPTNK